MGERPNLSRKSEKPAKRHGIGRRAAAAGGRAGGREEEEIGEKQALVGGFKQPNAGVAVGGSSDGMTAADGNEGRRKWENNALARIK